MKKIDKDNRVFASKAFQKDKYKFYIMVQSLKYETVKIYSDEKNYVLCQGMNGLPTWIWTRDNIGSNLIEEIESAMNLFLTSNNKFTCKKELYDLLIADKYECLNDDYFEIGSLSCEKTRKPRVTDGYMDFPNEDDKKNFN